MIRELEVLYGSKERWVALNLEKKGQYLQSILDNTMLNAHKWVELCAQAKGIPLQSDLISQEYFSGPHSLIRSVKILLKSLKKIEKNKDIISPRKVKKEGERLVAKVFPQNLADRMLWRKFSAEVWIEKNRPETQGTMYNMPHHNGMVCFVLGAGNVSSIAPLDAIDKLFHEGMVCLVKLNPVNEYLLPIFNVIFQDLIQDGFIKIVQMDNQTASLVTYNELVDEIHITGSHHTHDAIVWGDPNLEETKERREQNNPKLTKRITSELGCVTPIIYVPGKWSEADLKFHAKNLVSMVENNASFNCNAAKLIVLSKEWEQREEFLKYIREEFKNCAVRKAYYPGAESRFEKFVEKYPQAEKYGQVEKGSLPWLFIPNVGCEKNEMALNVEAFCGVLAEVSLESPNTADFIKKSVDFCNEKVWGTLSCALFVHPKTQRKNKQEIKNAIENLRYGAIGFNCWAAINYVLGVTTWGAYPGNTIQDVNSGIGFVHNELLIDFPEKSVVRAPFRVWPTPAWFYDRKNAIKIAKAFLQFEYTERKRDMMKLLRVVF